MRTVKVPRVLSEIWARGHQVEIRCLIDGGKPDRAYFPPGSDELLLRYCYTMSDRGYNLYYCLAGTLVGFVPKSRRATADSDCVERQFILLDVDPIKIGEDAKGNPATDAEMRAACRDRDAVVKLLMAEFGWPEPIVIDTGNGGAAIFQCTPDITNADVSAFLHSVATYFAHATRAANEPLESHIDTSVSNIARISRFPGYKNRKGEESDTRPHRLAVTVSEPEVLVSVTRELLLHTTTVFLEALGQKKKKEQPESTPNPQPSTKADPSADIESAFQDNITTAIEFLKTIGRAPLGPVKEKYEGQWAVIEIDRCPVRGDCAEQGDGGPCLLVSRQTGRIHFKCHHDRTCRNANLESVCKQYGVPLPQTKRAKPDTILDLAIWFTHDHDFFVDSISDKVFVTLDGQNAMPVRDSWYTSVIQNTYQLHTTKALKEATAKDAAASINAAVYHDPMTRRYPVARRFYSDETTVQVHLGGDDVVTITEDGWEIGGKMGVFFQRITDTDDVLPRPVRGGDIFRLFEFLNIQDTHDKVLLLAYLSYIPAHHSAYPIALFEGPGGSAKTTTIKYMNFLVDRQTKSAVRAFPKNEESFSIAAAQSRFLAYDNVGGKTLRDWGDELCRASTGASKTARKLYSDSEQVTVNYCTAVAVTGIAFDYVPSDLAQRVLSFHLKTKRGQVRTEKEMTAVWDKAAPELYGAYFTLIAEGLKRAKDVKQHAYELGRMGDYDQWTIAVASYLLNVDYDTAAKVIEERAKRNNEMQIDRSYIAKALLEFMSDKDTWEGTLSRLLIALTTLPGLQPDDEYSAFTNPTQLSRQLTQAQTALAAYGITWTCSRSRSNRIYTITRKGGQQ